MNIKSAIVILCLGFSTYLHAEFFDPSAEATEARITPIGKVRIALKSTPQLPFPSTRKTQIHLGKTLFETHCILCHGSGIAGAPRFGNEADWKPRIKKELSLLLKHVKNGYRAMPPKGTCLECSSADLEAAIHYMVKNAANN
ncbi:MAG: c-type cytochrome [Pseudomonadota bacterium]